MAKRKSTTKSKKIGKTTKTETTTKSKGLGDTIEKITEATGIKAVVKAIAGEDCGCDERKEWLNKKFPYKKVQCLDPEEKEYLSGGILKEKRISREDQEMIAKIHSRVFSHKFHVPCSCNPSIWKQWIRELNDMLDAPEEVS
jgi:chaperonin GroEL (HSP60 family)